MVIDNLERFNKCVDEASVEEKKVLVRSVIDRVVWDGDNGEVRIFYQGFDEEQFKDNCLHLDTERICMDSLNATFIHNLYDYSDLPENTFGQKIKELNGDIWFGTLAIMALLLVIGVSYNLAKSYEENGLQA